MSLALSSNFRKPAKNLTLTFAKPQGQNHEFCDFTDNFSMCCEFDPEFNLIGSMKNIYTLEILTGRFFPLKRPNEYNHLTPASWAN
jgi:hypothetical protein